MYLTVCNNNGNRRIVHRVVKVLKVGVGSCIHIFPLHKPSEFKWFYTKIFDGDTLTNKRFNPINLINLINVRVGL